MDADVIQIAEYLESNDPKELVKKAVSSGDTEGFIVDLNTRRQLGKFENAKGEKLADIGGEYSEFTQIEKGLGPREVNLYDDGDYWESFQTNPLNDGDYEIVSDPTKPGGVNIEDRYGYDLEGLQRENEKKANEFIETKIWEQAEESL